MELNLIRVVNDGKGYFFLVIMLILICCLIIFGLKFLFVYGLRDEFIISDNYFFWLRVVNFYFLLEIKL